MAQTGIGITDPALDLIDQLSLESRAAFYIYKDSDSGFNNSFPSGLFGAREKVHLNTACVYDSTSSDGCATNSAVLDRTRGTVVKIQFDSLSAGEFAGLNWEEPQNFGANGGGRGYDLSGSTRVCFDALSLSPSLQVQFGVAQHMSTFMGFQNQWSRRCIDLASLSLSAGDLTNLHFPFTITTNDVNARQGGSLLLDNIDFEPVPLSQTTILSFPMANAVFGVVPAPGPLSGRVQIPPDQINANVATTYESALSLIALLTRRTSQDLAAARSIADTFVYALGHDNQGLPLPVAPGGYTGLRNAYSAGRIDLFNGQGTGAGQQGQTRLAGYSITAKDCGPTLFCLVSDGATGGNNSFAILGLTAAYQQFGDSRYLDAARTIGNWIYFNLQSDTDFGGYYLGYPDKGQPKLLIYSKSTENNADIFRAFSTLADLMQSAGQSAEAAEWNRRAAIAGDFVMKMYDGSDGHFNAGTNSQASGAETINQDSFLDAQSFVLLALANSPRYVNAIDWRRPVAYMVNQFAQTVTAGGQQLRGFDLVRAPDSGPNGVAWEFTAQVVLAMRTVDALYGEQQFEDQAQMYLNEIRRGQQLAPYTDGNGLVAAVMDSGDTLPPYESCISTPFQCIAERTGLAATAFAAFADMNVSPFAMPSPSPLAGSYEILNGYSGKALEDSGFSLANGAAAGQWDYFGSPNQLWRVIPAAGGSFRILNEYSGKVLEDSGFSQMNGAVAGQWDYFGSPNQLWQVLEINPNTYRIINGYSGKALEDTGFSIDNGTPAGQWDYTGSPNQSWILVRLGP